MRMSQNNQQAKIQNNAALEKQLYIQKIILETFQTETGQECLKLLTKIFVEPTNLPVGAEIISRFGNVEVYLAFLQGQKSIINYLLQCIENAKNPVSLEVNND